MATETRRRSRRLELRTTPAERDLIDRAAALTETDLTEFVVANAVEAAAVRSLIGTTSCSMTRRELPWEAINARRAGSCPGWPPDGPTLSVRGVTRRYRPPEALDAQHDVSGFVCRSVEQTDWLTRHAAVDRDRNDQGIRRDRGRPGRRRRLLRLVHGLSLTRATPARLRRGAGRYPQPIALLASASVSTSRPRRTRARCRAPAGRVRAARCALGGHWLSGAARALRVGRSARTSTSTSFPSSSRARPTICTSCC